MKVKLSKIHTGDYTVRENIDEEQVQRIKESLKQDGQWNPVILRPRKDGEYDLVAGHYRLEGAKALGWRDIEANVQDLNDTDADITALKTNLMRLDMEPREQGKVLKRMIDRYGISQRELARRLQKSKDWVIRRIRLVLDLSPEVSKALEHGDVNFTVASEIATVPQEKQPEFLSLVLAEDIKDRKPARRLRQRFLNDTIYTIGYQGRDVESFIDILKANEIELLVDVRHSNKSEKKPEFNGKVLAKALKQEGIEYTHIKELGIPHEIQEPYKDGVLSKDCLKQWYKWQIARSGNVSFPQLIDDWKGKGHTVLMCMERYAKAHRDQKYDCHRHILAEFIRQPPTEKLEEVETFHERVDL